MDHHVHIVSDIEASMLKDKTRVFNCKEITLITFFEQYNLLQTSRDAQFEWELLEWKYLTL